MQSTSSTGHSYSSTSAYILVSDQPVPRPPYQLSQLHGKGISSAEMPTLNHSHHLKFSPASLSEHCPSCRLAKTISHAYRESTTRMALAGVRTVHATALLHLEPSSKPVGKPQPKRRNSFPHSYAVACRKEGTRHTPNAALTPKLCTLAKSYTTLRLAGQCAVRSLGRPATMVRNGLIRRSCALWGRWVPLIGKARVLVLALAAVGVAGGWGRSGASAILALRERNLCDLHLLTRSRCGTLVVLRYMCGTD